MSKPAKNPFLRNFLELFPAPLRNRYFMVLLAFGIWMLFFDNANILTQWQLGKSVQKLENDKTYYEERIQEANVEQRNLEDNVEEYAREKYYMKKSNEDVFIIEEEKQEEN